MSTGPDAPSLVERMKAVKVELGDLQREMEGLQPSLSSFHAVNWLRQAQTLVEGSLRRLPESAASTAPRPAPQQHAPDMT